MTGIPLGKDFNGGYVEKKFLIFINNDFEFVLESFHFQCVAVTFLVLQIAPLREEVF